MSRRLTFPYQEAEPPTPPRARVRGQPLGNHCVASSGLQRQALSVPGGRYLTEAMSRHCSEASLRGLRLPGAPGRIQAHGTAGVGRAGEAGGQERQPAENGRAPPGWTGDPPAALALSLGSLHAWDRHLPQAPLVSSHGGPRGLVDGDAGHAAGPLVPGCGGRRGREDAEARGTHGVGNLGSRV